YAWLANRFAIRRAQPSNEYTEGMGLFLSGFFAHYRQNPDGFACRTLGLRIALRFAGPSPQMNIRKGWGFFYRASSRTIGRILTDSPAVRLACESLCDSLGPALK
ncbi:hypothetical protein B4O97_16340, partial [Marispirochaeta aestuarii]